MSGEIPEDLRYSESDEWVRQGGDDVTVGITAFAAEQLGDIVFVQLPGSGEACTAGAPFGEIESVKAASELLSPVSGEVTAMNEELDANPALVNEDPYGRGWLIKVRLSNPGEYGALLDAAAYEKSTAERQ